MQGTGQNGIQRNRSLFEEGADEGQPQAGLAAVSMLTTAVPLKLLVNAGFDDPATDSGMVYYGAGNGCAGLWWRRLSADAAAVGMPARTHFGDQILKMFGGCCSGAQRDFAASEGQTRNGDVYPPQQQRPYR